MTSAKPRIFVLMVSYRDPECHHTIRDLFERAAHPERIFVGVCWQYDPEQDADYLRVPYPRADQVRVVQFHSKDAEGAGWARVQAHALWQGEEYILQIQAHHRFEQGWDETLILLLAQCPSEKPVLTAWLPGYRPPNQKQALNGMLPLSVVNRIGGATDVQMVHLIKRMVPAESLAGKVLPTAFWVGNFMFTHARTLKEVPFDPYIYFWGEELNYSLRLWTHGYDLFHLNKLALYHYWDRDGVKDESMYRSFSNERNRLSLARNLHLFGIRQAGDERVLAQLSSYGLGDQRSMESFWRYAGVDLATGAIADHARQGIWPLTQRETKITKSTPKIFIAIASYRDPEISHTLADLFSKASNPERLRVGVCLQIDPAHDKDCDVRSDRMSQITLRQVHPKDSLGANWARAEALKLRQDEAYILTIDSHMRFEEGWDQALIDMLARCPSEKPVISAYLPNYDPPNQRDYTPAHLLRIRVRRFGEADDPQLLHITGKYVPSSETDRVGLTPCPFIVANFMFARAELFDEVPIDPHFHFYGDELSYAARLWTHGWDVFQPDRIVAFHYWVRKSTLHLQHYRGIHSPPNQLARERGLHLLGFKQAEHPEALAETSHFGLGSLRRLEDLWAFAGIDWSRRQIAPDALEGKWNMAARKKNSEAKEKRPRIFVQIASYRDPDCQYTVKDIFEKATHPERIFVGICWQTVKGEDDICFKVPYPRPEQVRVREVNAKESRGVCWARSLTQELWQGEEFTMQIDSHMRFEQGWDETLLGMWNDCDNSKAVLTCYPPGFTPPNDCQRDWIFGMSAKEFDKHGIFLMKGAPGYRVSKLPEKPMPGAFLSGCMYFGPASIIEDVPYDPHLYFFGEEITYAVRLWTHGYDLYYPNRLFIYHDWDRSKRPTHFSDHRDWGKLNDLSFARTKHMLGTEITTKPEALKELDKYGLGKARSLAEYQEYSGVDFSAKTISERAAKGEFGKASAAPAMPRIFVQIASYRDPECQWTVKDLFEKATYPDRITVGICWQFDPDQDAHCFEISTRPDQVKVLPYDWREAEGVCWARHQTQQLWEGEEYSLQIDSHMRFTPGWDESLIAELAACDSKKPVLSCSPASYIPPNKLEQNPRPTVRRVMPFFADGNIRGRGEALTRSPSRPLNGAFIAAGFVFAKSEILREVPYDPYLYFDQEEITYAARLYTHGWDVFSTRRPLLYHYYNTGDQNRPMHWNDLRQHNPEKIHNLKSRGLTRFNHLTGFRQAGDMDVIKEIAFYGFGTARSFEQFEAYCGIDFKKKVASERALRAEFIQGLEQYRDDRIYVPELDGPSPKPASEAMLLRRPSSKEPMTGMLEVGDFMPMFAMTDSNLKHHNLELNGGHWGVLVYLPRANEDYLVNFLSRFHQLISASGKMDVWVIFMLDDSAENLARLREKHALPQVLMADPGRVIARALGLVRSKETAPPPVGFVVNRNLKITKRYQGKSAMQLAEALVADLRTSISDDQKQIASPQVIRKLPPVLIVPDVFSPEFCRRCIEVFRTGRTFDGTVGAEEKMAYNSTVKVRTDYVVHGDLLSEIDDKLSRSLFPEIKKIFGFEVTNREYYKIGLYSGDKEGFFKQHRDNFDAPVGYRRVAMTLHLSDDYEGGGLHFPEYDHHIYRPELGSAIAFSCATMHEARPVTKGERFVLVGFFHGREEEAFRQHYRQTKHEPLKTEDFTPVLRQFPSELDLARSFYSQWQAKNIAYNNVSTDIKNKMVGQVMSTQSPNTPTSKAPGVITTLGGHQPKKVFESKQALVYDDFLPEDVYEKIYAFALKTDYEHINTKGKVSRAWHVHDGFPLRSLLNLFYYPEGIQKPQGDYVYPTKTHMDEFMDHILAMQSHIEHFVGKMGKDWSHVTATNWIYPHGTGLAMHDDGSGVYTGAYAYFLNPVWKLHWGGLNLMIEDEGNKLVYDYRNSHDQMDFYNRKWLNANSIDELLMEHGFARCIFPKRNRIVFIANNAYHMVTRVNEQCGDNLRMSIAGFYNRKK